MERDNFKWLSPVDKKLATEARQCERRKKRELTGVRKGVRRGDERRNGKGGRGKKWLV